MLEAGPPPRPPGARVYPTGPNVNPRSTAKKPELHGVPRPYPKMDRATRRRDPETGKWTWKMKPVESYVLAEDPGMYPPAVRLAMADMLEELGEFPFQGNPLILDEPTTTYAGRSEPTRLNGAGAPVYHDIKAYVEGAKGKADGGAAREEVFNAIYDALTKGKGSEISDAAAQVARSGWKRLLPEGSGGHRIGWVDQAGEKSPHPLDLSPERQAAREMSDQEVHTGLKMLDELGGIPGVAGEEAQAFYRALQHEGVTRGLRLPTQQSLRMEGPGGTGGVPIDDPRSAAEIAQAMSELRTRQPRPLAKLYGQRGPTPEQATAHAEQTRAWNREMRRLRKLHGSALERDNAAFAAEQPEGGGPPPKPRVPADTQRGPGWTERRMDPEQRARFEGIIDQIWGSKGAGLTPEQRAALPADPRWAAEMEAVAAKTRAMRGPEPPAATR